MSCAQAKGHAAGKSVWGRVQARSRFSKRKEFLLLYTYPLSGPQQGEQAMAAKAIWYVCVHASVLHVCLCLGGGCTSEGVPRQGDIWKEEGLSSDFAVPRQHHLPFNCRLACHTLASKNAASYALLRQSKAFAQENCAWHTHIFCYVAQT